MPKNDPDDLKFSLLLNAVIKQEKMHNKPQKNSKCCWMIFALMAGSSLLNAPQAQAIEKFGKESSLDIPIEQLFSATVTSASKMPEKLRDVPAAITVLNQEDILRSGATSIPEALRMVPGVQVARIDASGWAIGVRGFNSALDNKLLI